MVKTAVDNFGKLDICINNAGILRDKSFKNMTDDNWEIVLDVHLRGTYYVTKAAYDRMIEQGTGGRIIMTSSTSGLLGNFGQTNYGAAKAGIAGFMRCLAPEGAKYGITVNLLAPAAWSRLTEDIMPAAAAEPLAPEKVSPAVVWLCTDEAAGVTGRTFVVGGNKVHLLAWQHVPIAGRPNEQEPWGVAEIGKRILDSVEKWPKPAHLPGPDVALEPASGPRSRSRRSARSRPVDGSPLPERQALAAAVYLPAGAFSEVRFQDDFGVLGLGRHRLEARSIRDPRQGRRRWIRRRLPRARPGARPGGGDQDAAPSRGRRHARGVAARSARRFGAEPPFDRHHPRLRRGRRLGVHRHGVGRGRDPARDDRARASGAAHRLGSRQAARLRADARARRRHHAPRSQARERDGAPGRRAQGPRLRPGAAPARRVHHAAGHAHQGGVGDGAVHVAGAAPRRAARCGFGSLLARRAALRDGHRTAPVRRRRSSVRCGAPHPLWRSRPAQRPGRAAGGLGSVAAAAPGEGPRSAARLPRGPALGVGSGRRRPRCAAPRARRAGADRGARGRSRRGAGGARPRIGRRPWPAGDGW